MLFLYTSIAYSLITLIIALILYFKSRKSYQSRFFLVCVSFLILYSIAGNLSSLPIYKHYEYLLEPAIIFFFSLVPFFFLHFIIIYTGQSELYWKKFVIAGIYITGLFAYTMILLGYIPNPLAVNGLLSDGGYIFYLTWMSVFFSIGISELFYIFGGFYETGIKSKMFFSSFALLILVLPGPFAESIFKMLFGQSKVWYSLISTVALTFSVYLIFRHKLVVTFYDALRTTISVMKEIILRTDNNFVIQSAQGAIELTLGYCENDMIGKALPSFFSYHDDDERRNNIWFERKIHDGLIDIDVIDSKKNPIPMSFSFSPLLNGEVIVGYVGIGRTVSERKQYEKDLLDAKANLEFLVNERTVELKKVNLQLQQDITERKKAEDELLVLNDTLKTVNSSKDKFFTIVAHDLKAPFQGLLGYSKLLADDFESLSSEELRDYSNNINQISKNIFDMVENLLYWARVQIGKTDFQPVPINIEEVANDVIHTMSHNALRKEISLLSEVNADLTVNADEKMFYSILQNLVSNAIKFTDNGGSVVISASKLLDYIEISVKDTGIGIEPGDVERLFNLDNSFKRKGTAHEEGTGLGLILSKELIEKHKGSMRVESELGKGSTFIFSIPSV